MEWLVPSRFKKHAVNLTPDISEHGLMDMYSIPNWHIVIHEVMATSLYISYSIIAGMFELALLVRTSSPTR